MEDNPIWSKWSHYRHVPSKENSTTIDAKICQLGTDTRWHFGKCPLSNHNLQPDPLDVRHVVNRRWKSRTSPMHLDLDCIYKRPFRTNWHNFWDGKSNTTVLTHELLDAQDLRLVSNFYLIRAQWTCPDGPCSTFVRQLIIFEILSEYRRKTKWYVRHPNLHLLWKRSSWTEWVFWR